MADVDVAQQISEIKALQGEQLRATNDLSVFLGRIDERLNAYVRDLETYKKDNNRRVMALEDRADATDRRIWKWSGAIGIIAIIAAPLAAHFLPVQPLSRKAEQVVATEKRQDYYPPRKEHPQEGK